jgi:type I restriction enzyme R subunit
MMRRTHATNTIRDKLSENERVMHQIANNSPEQALLGDFAGALDEAVIGSSEAHQSQMLQYLNNKDLQAGFQRVIFDMLLAGMKQTGTSHGSTL